MELSKKTTILLSPRLFELLKSKSRSEESSIGALIRAACEKQYGWAPEADVHAAVDRLSSLALPIAGTDLMKRESVPRPEELMP